MYLRNCVQTTYGKIHKYILQCLSLTIQRVFSLLHVSHISFPSTATTVPTKCIRKCFHATVNDKSRFTCYKSGLFATKVESNLFMYILVEICRTISMRLSVSLRCALLSFKGHEDTGRNRDLLICPGPSHALKL